MDANFNRLGLLMILFLELFSVVFDAFISADIISIEILMMGMIEVFNKKNEWYIKHIYIIL